MELSQSPGLSRRRGNSMLYYDHNDVEYINLGGSCLGDTWLFQENSMFLVDFVIEIKAFHKKRQGDLR